MKIWIEKTKPERDQQKVSATKDSISGAYKKEILDTRITVSEITREIKAAESQIFGEKQNPSGNLVFQ